MNRSYKIDRDILDVHEESVRGFQPRGRLRLTYVEILFGEQLKTVSGRQSAYYDMDYTSRELTVNTPDVSPSNFEADKG